MKILRILKPFIFLLIVSACGNLKTHQYEKYQYEIVSEGLEELYSFDQSYDEKYKDHGENPFINVDEQPVSTFSVDADGTSYSNMRRYVNLGQNPPKESVRIEEYINYFTFDYPEPSGEEYISLDTELSACPWNVEHHLMRIGIKGKSIPEKDLPASNYVFLIDVSGSMNSPDKIGILKAGFNTLVDQLSDLDKVAIVTYAGKAGIALPSTSCDQREKIHAAINVLEAGGSTAGAAGIITAYEIAQQNCIPDGNNRIILGSDGDYNVGPSSTEELVELIEEKRDKGIYLTVLGVGGGNLNDHMMEQLANNGNGTYEYIDNVSQMEKVFIHEKSKLYTIAKDCKIQVHFDPGMVEAYRLIGYENRALKEEDFEDDKKDAGEIGVNQTITALYEVVLKSTPASSQYARLDVRYKKPGQEESRLLSQEIDSKPVDIVSASENMRFISSVAAFGMLMKESQYKGTATLKMIQELSAGSVTFDPHGYRKEFKELLQKVKK
jgi:Ca-activated chloride channel family protein